MSNQDLIRAEATNESANSLAERKNALIEFKKTHMEESHQSSDEIDLRAIWALVLRRKWTVIVFFLIIVVTAIVASMMMTPMYRSTVVLQIDRQEAKVVDYQDVNPTESPAEGKEFYSTQYELLKSRTMAEKIINQLNLASDITFSPKPSQSFLSSIFSSKPSNENVDLSYEAKLDSLIDKFIAGLKVEPVKNSRLVKVSFESSSPILAEKVANAIASTYINVNLERRMDATSYAKTFLQDQLNQVRARLEESEKQLVSFSREMGIIKSEDEDGTGTDVQILKEYTSALSKAEQERIQAESKFKQIQKSSGAGLQEVIDNKVIQGLKARKANLDAEYQDGLQIYKPDYPSMLQKKGQINEIQGKIDDEIKNVKLSIQMRFEAAKAEEEGLRSKLAEARAEVLAVQDKSIKYGILKREVDTNRQLYDGLLQRMKEVSVSGGVGLNNISVVDQAKMAKSPFKPKLVLNILIAAILGLVGGVLLVILIEMLDDTMKDPADFEKILHLPILGVIPVFKRKATEDENSALIEENLDPRSSLAEAYRSLRTSLQFTTSKGTPKSILLTSTSAGEGKSTTSISLAIQFAKAGKSVLLIDLDLRKATLHKVLRVSNDLGITNYLAGDATPAEITRKTPIENFYIIPSGPLPPNPAELITSGKMFSFLSLASEKFDLIIIDGPPVLGLADAPLLGNLVEATVLVVEAGKVRKDHAKNSIKRLHSTHTNILGGVMTKVGSGSNSYGYDSYYSYDYGHS